MKKLFAFIIAFAMLTGISMVFGVNSAMAQTVTVTGTVITAGFTPFSGASVKVKGTTTATLTDSNGKYSISCPVGGKLEYSHILCVTVEELVDSRRVIDVMLVESPPGNIRLGDEDPIKFYPLIQDTIFKKKYN